VPVAETKRHGKKKRKSESDPREKAEAEQKQENIIRI